MLVLGILEKRSYRISPDAFLDRTVSYEALWFGMRNKPADVDPFLNVTDF
jgi:hypothetical protein